MNIRFYDEKEAKRFCDEVTGDEITCEQHGVHVVTNLQDDFDLDMILLGFDWRDYDG